MIGGHGCVKGVSREDVNECFAENQVNTMKRSMPEREIAVVLFHHFLSSFVSIPA